MPRTTGRIATDDEVIGAAQKAQCHEFISLLKKGYDTEVPSSTARGKTQPWRFYICNLHQLAYFITCIIFLYSCPYILSAFSETELHRNYQTPEKSNYMEQSVLQIHLRCREEEIFAYYPIFNCFWDTDISN